MREIKFRAWSEERKLMIKPEMLSPRFLSLNGKRMYIESERMACFGGGYNLKKESFTDLMQYAGTKNGIDIYFGDILKADDDSFYAVVEFDDRELMFSARLYQNGNEIELMGLSRFMRSRELAVNGKIKIIGNIHENLELLETNND